jgi:subtilase family serine protease
MNVRVCRSLIAGFMVVAFVGCASAQHSIPALSSSSVDETDLPAVKPSDRAIVSSVPAPNDPVHDLGRAPSKQVLPIAVTLRYRNEGQLQAFIAREEELPRGSRHQWLTNEQFDARFAPSSRDYSRVAAALQRAGLRVTQQFENHTVIDAQGSVGALERYFNTQIDRVEQVGHGTRYMNVRAAYEPADLSGLLLSVDGLSTLSMVHLFAAPASRASGTSADAVRADGSKLFGHINPTRSNAIGYGPAAFQIAYDFPEVHAAGKTVYNGAGHATAFIMDADFIDSDIATFVKYFGITRPASKTIRVPIDGGSPPGDEALDSIFTTFIGENIAALAPGADLYVFEIHPGFPLNDITDAYNRIVSDNRVDAVATSFGNCEQAIPTTTKAWSAIAEQALAKGIVFAAGSGDEGGILCTSTPASSPNFTAVGGTSLTIGPGGSWFAEPGYYASSGGVSRLFPLPPWQNGVSGNISSGRNVPDIAFDANPTEGAAGYIAANGGWSSGINPYWGTGLLATSIYVAALTQIDQMKGERTGLASDKLFTMWKKLGYGTQKHPYFHDATEGGSGLYFAVPGYDFVTGIGSIDFWNLAQKM